MRFGRNGQNAARRVSASTAGRNVAEARNAAAIPIAAIGPRLSASATTSLLDRLENAGHLHRVRSEHDRRVVELRMDERVLALGRELFAPLGTRMSRAWAGFDTEQRQAIAHFLRVSITATVETRHGIDSE